MGSFASLWLSKYESTSDDGYIEDTELQMKWLAPIGWLALFNAQDFHIRKEIDEDGHPYSTLFLTRPIGDAIQLLKERSYLFTEAMGENWSRCIDQFVRFLENSEAKYVHLDFSNLLDDDCPAEELRDGNAEIIDKMTPPATIEKKSLFGKKKIVLTRAWKHVLNFTTDYKKDKILPCWTWFGSPPNGRDDWL